MEQMFDGAGFLLLLPLLTADAVYLPLPLNVEHGVARFYSYTI